MVECVTDQMIERCLEPIENIAVDAGGLADDLKSRLLAQLTSQVTNQTRETPHAVGQWPHPAGQHFMVQPAGNILADPRKFFDRLDRLAQPLQILGACALDLASSSCSAAGSVIPWLDSRSSKSCNDSSSPVCLPFSRQSDSTSGGSR